MEVASTSCAFIASFLVAWSPGTIVKFAFSIALTCLAFLMIFNVKLTSTTRRTTRLKGGWVRRVVLPDGTYEYSVSIPLLQVLGGLAGLASGFLGVGGGIVKVPAMVLVLGVPIHVAVATSAFMITLTVTAGFVGHALNGHVAFAITPLLAPSLVLGAYLGARLSHRVRAPFLRRVFGLALLCVAVKMALS